MPAIEGVLETDFIENPIKGMAPISILTHLPALAGILGPDFPKNQ